MTSSSAAALAPSAAALAPSVAVARACFNVHCRKTIADAAPDRQRGWQLRTGEFVDLCDRCLSLFQQGMFCQMFHSEAAGWCNCRACGKRLHGACIVALPTYVFLDCGGVECVACDRKSHIVASNHIWPPPSVPPAQASERPKDLPVKSANPVTMYPRQVHRIWNLASNQSDLNRRLAYEFDRPNVAERLMSGMRSNMLGQEKKLDNSSERISANSLNPLLRNRSANGSSKVDSVSTVDNIHKQEGTTNGVQGSGNHGEIDPVPIRKSVSSNLCSTSSSGVNCDMYPKTHANTSLPSSSVLNDDPSLQRMGMPVQFPFPRDAHDPSRVSVGQPQGKTSSMVKQLSQDSQNVVDSQLQAQMRNGRPRMDSRARSHLLPRYWPRSTDQELQKISGASNSVITPLFEKMLSASDAGRIGRLVLPKKCAEVYFPAISQPEGLPLKVQDVKGKEWVFQFRFWPNNNSRMYVLEGVTPCIQSMQLQAGDIVTFSRLDPEGKLIMGFRKAESNSADQDNEVIKDGSNVILPPEADNQTNTPNTANLPPRSDKGPTELQSPISTEDQASLSKIDQESVVQKDRTSKKSSLVPNRRKGSTLGPKSKRLRIENEDSIELKLTWQEAQDLIRPPPNHLSSIVVIDGHEVEEYVEAPVLGMPTIFATNQAGEKHQWAKCESCSKWRKLPEDALLTFRWTCADNKWDPERSSCAASQELSDAQLADILPTNTGASKRSKAKVGTEAVAVSDGLDTLANLAILGEGESLPSSSQLTTKHPRHRPGCTCIVCIQPPSGKGPKHRQSCTCNVCLTVKRRFRTLMMRKEAEKEAETARKKKQQQQLTESASQFLPQEVDGESERRTASTPRKNRIDLNSQPEREEEQSQSGSDIHTSKCDWLPKPGAEGETLA